VRVRAAYDHLVATGEPAKEPALGMGRPGRRYPGGDVVLVRVVVPLLPVLRAGEVERDPGARRRGDAFQHVCAAVGKPLPHADRRGDLEAVDLIGRRVNAVTNP